MRFAHRGQLGFFLLLFLANGLSFHAYHQHPRAWSAPPNQTSAKPMEKQSRKIKQWKKIWTSKELDQTLSLLLAELQEKKSGGKEQRKSRAAQTHVNLGLQLRLIAFLANVKLVIADDEPEKNRAVSVRDAALKLTHHLRRPGRRGPPRGNSQREKELLALQKAFKQGAKNTNQNVLSIRDIMYVGDAMRLMKQIDEELEGAFTQYQTYHQTYQLHVKTSASLVLAFRDIIDDNDWEKHSDAYISQTQQFAQFLADPKGRDNAITQNKKVRQACISCHGDFR